MFRAAQANPLDESVGELEAASCSLARSLGVGDVD